MSDASGIEITDDGVVYVASQSKGTLLKITDAEIEAVSLIPDAFKDSDLGGVGATADGNLVVTNIGSCRCTGPDLALITRFSQDGNDPGELDKRTDVVVSINNNVYVADSKNKRISVFNQQGLYLHSFGWHSSWNLKKPSHISIDAEENV